MLQCVQQVANSDFALAGLVVFAHNQAVLFKILGTNIRGEFAPALQPVREGLGKESLAL